MIITKGGKLGKCGDHRHSNLCPDRVLHDKLVLSDSRMGEYVYTLRVARTPGMLGRDQAGLKSDVYRFRKTASNR
jgi:hypothetical protein